MQLTALKVSQMLKVLTNIGVALSAEKDHARLLEKILENALAITDADGGTIYTCTDQNSLQFDILINKSLDLHIGGTSPIKPKFPDLPLYDEQGKPNFHMLAPSAAVTRKTIHIQNAYRNRRYDLSGTKLFDKTLGYHSQSFFTVPMTNHLNEVIGVLQLINAQDPKTKKIIAFSKLKRDLVQSLASQAAVIITNRQLIDDQKKLFDALIQLIAKAIDEKSPYTGNHCRRVPVITKMLATAACQAKQGVFKNYQLSDEEMYELEVAAWLHDCGKITIPEAVVDKATKLEGIIDGIKLVDLRFEILKRDSIIQALTAKLNQQGIAKDILKERSLQKQLKQFDAEKAFIQKINIGSETIAQDDLKKIKNIAQKTWINEQGKKETFLSEKELHMLSIHRGTLSHHERGIINNHVSMTIKMLESLPYPKNLKRVPELAGAHHEKMDGSGYPKGLSKDTLSIEARMIALADVFEALTAGDRPYKKAMSLTQALNILGQMKLEGHIDPDLFDLFMEAKLYLRYADEFLPQAKQEKIDLKSITGYGHHRH